VWLAYPAGMLEGARLLDAPPHHVSGEETAKIAKDYEFLVLFTSTPGFPGDIRLAQATVGAGKRQQSDPIRAPSKRCTPPCSRPKASLGCEQEINGSPLALDR
jgi:hypothetical protein